jgi:hypothetical protein
MARIALEDSFRNHGAAVVNAEIAAHQTRPRGISERVVRL